MDGCILMRVDPEKASETIEALMNIPGVRRTFLVFGQYDIVAFIEAPTYEALSKITVKIQALTYIKSTETLLEALSESEVPFQSLT
jgi:uncharacterized protein with GYD domain